MEYVLFFFAICFIIIAIMLSLFFYFSTFHMSDEKKNEIKALYEKIKFQKIIIPLPNEVSKDNMVSSSPKFSEYVKSIPGGVHSSIDKLTIAKQQCKDAIQEIESKNFEPAIQKPRAIFLDKIPLLHKLYLLSVNHYELIFSAINDKKNEVIQQYTEQIEEIDKQLNELKAISQEVLPLSKSFPDDFVPIVLPDLGEYDIYMLKEFEILEQLPQSKKFHDCIDIDTYSLKFKNAHYYFYRNVLVVDDPISICIMDYSDLNSKRAEAKITRGKGGKNYSWSGPYLNVKSKLGGFDVEWVSQNEDVLEWLDTCFSLSTKKKTYTNDDVKNEILSKIEEEKKRLEAKKTDRRNRPDYYEALDWVKEQEETIRRAKQTMDRETDKLKKMHAKTAYLNVLTKVIIRTREKLNKATGEALKVYEDFNNQIESSMKSVL